MFGYMGEVLRVNLTTEKIVEEKLDESLAKKFLGGRGLGAKILFDELKPDIDPLGPENKLIVTAGLITGIPIPGNGRYAIMAKSPLTSIWGESHSGGFFGPELKFTGYDVVIIEGRSETPVYLWVHDGEAEIKDASNLWGKITGDTQRIIREETKDKRTRVACIGPGGENLVKYACVISDLMHANGRTGMGSVMGSKKLKAIAIRGTRKIEFADNKKMRDLIKKAHKQVRSSAYFVSMSKYGTSVDVAPYGYLGRLPSKAFMRCTFEGYENITGESMAETILLRPDSCYACPFTCHRIVKAEEPYIVDPAYGGPEYETIAALGSLCLNNNLVAIAKANELCNKYTLDTISTGVVIAFAMECYEKGLITKDDTQGIELTWGNHKAMIELIEKIAKREGIGDLLAGGVKRASEKIGRGSEEFALHIKGQELPMHEPRTKKGIAIGYATSNRGACHLQGEHDDVWTYCITLPQDELAEVGIDERDISKAKDLLFRRYAGKEKVKLEKITEDIWSLSDCLTMCKFVHYPDGAITPRTLVDVVNAATGWDVASFRELMTVGERAINLCRSFNVREGMTRKDDRLPKRLMEPLTEGTFKGEAIPEDVLNSMLDHYYELRGWDKDTGIPTRKKLGDLELKHVADELEKLELLPT